MKKLRFLALVLVLALCVTLTASCQKKSTTHDYTKGVTFAIAVHATASETARNMTTGAVEAAEALGWKVMVVSAEGSMERHSQNVETLANAGADFIGIIGGDSRALVPAIEYAASKGSLVIGIDSGVSGTGVITNVTSDNKEIGRQITRYMVERLGSKGNILVIDEPTYWACRERMEGREEVLKDYPGIKVIASTTVQYPGTMAQALAATETWLLANPKGTIDAIWGTYDLAAVGAASAVLSAGRTEIFVTGVDGDQEAIMKYVLPGKVIAATIRQDMLAIGGSATGAAKEYVDGKRDFAQDVFVPTLLVTKDNATEVAKGLWPDLFPK